MRIRLVVFPVFFIAAQSLAQHEMHMHHDSTSMPHHDSAMHMSHAFSRNLPMTRNGSGTGWMPDSTVMYGHGVHAGKWMFMMMANVFVRYNKQDLANKGSRGGEKFDAPDWIMFMGQANVGKRGLFRFSSMISLDPLTVGNEGYPLLFQSGETYKGQRLVDRQHPHDLFSELSAAYTHMFSKDLDLTGYMGYPGEPAIGPVTFMHRISALNNPDAPLSHHWQDATHIVFGVGTLGLRYKKLKIEGSCFSGREPDENRYNFDAPRFDSYSFRVLYNPNPYLAFQASQAFLKSPEAADPGNDIKRTTSSLIGHVPFSGKNRYLASTFSWGLNESDHEENSFLLESNLQLDRLAMYGRYEWVEKSADDLALPQFNNGHKARFNIQALTLGANYALIRKAGNNVALGVQGSVFVPDSRLETLYGKQPFSGEVYLRVFPHLMHMHHH